MKKLIMTFGIFLSAIIGMQAQEKVASGAHIDFETDVIDYGTIEQNADGVREFKFTNTGNEPLVISNAKGSCGCTVPSWPKKPINPGETAVIQVKYATNRLGPINKSVTVQSNADNETVVLRIKGNVVEKKTTPTKENVGAPVAN